MTAREDFVAWVKTALYEAELALHNGDAAPPSRARMVRRGYWPKAVRSAPSA